MYPDYRFATIDGKPVKALINDGYKLAILKDGEKNPSDPKTISVIENRDNEVISALARISSLVIDCPVISITDRDRNTSTAPPASRATGSPAIRSNQEAAGGAPSGSRFENTLRQKFMDESLPQWNQGPSGIRKTYIEWPMVATGFSLPNRRR